MAGTRRFRGAAVGALAAAVLIVLALAASSPLGPLMRMAPRTAAPPPPLDVLTATPEPEPEQPPLPPVEANQTAADALGWGLLAVGALIALAVLALIVRWLARRRWSAPGVGRGAADDRPEGGVQVDGDEIAADVHVTLADSLARLRSGIAVGDAIVACWRRLEEVAATSGAERQPTDTAEEFTVTVLRHTAADPADLRELADIYRAALFGARPPDEADRERAIACLTRIVDALEGVRA